MPSDNTPQAPSERRARTRKEIKKLIEDRNSVLSQYYNLAKFSETSSDDLSGTAESLEEFCQNLVDYIATGHFEIYSRIEEGQERRDEILTLAKKIMPRLNNTTQVALAFNDLYDDTSNIGDDAIHQLPSYLDKLGEELATRIDLEDKIINTLLAVSCKPELSTVNA